MKKYLFVFMVAFVSQSCMILQTTPTCYFDLAYERRIEKNMAEGKYKEALEIYDSIKTDKNSSRYLYAKALCERKAKNFESAMKYIDRIIKVDPEYSFFTAYVTKAMLYCDMDNAAQCIAFLEDILQKKIITSKPQLVNCYKIIILAYKRVGNETKVLEYKNIYMKNKRYSW